jgi:hypothetical protein
VKKLLRSLLCSSGELIIFFQSNRSHQNTCFHHVERNLSDMAAPTAAVQQYPPSRVATTSSRITLRISGADSATETTEADNDKVSS